MTQANATRRVDRKNAASRHTDGRGKGTTGTGGKGAAEPGQSASGQDGAQDGGRLIDRFTTLLSRAAGSAGHPAFPLFAFLRYAARRFSEDNLFQTAAALTYTTLLSLVPLAAISIAILSAFPAFSQFQDEVQSLVFQAMVPEVGDAVLDQLLILAENAGSLTAFGLIGTLVTAFMLLATIESAFNGLWRVKVNRPLTTRLLSFWAVLTFAPILAAFSISLTAQFLSGAAAGGDSTLVGIAVRTLIAPGVEFLLLGLLFLIIPNRDVRYGDAAIGAAIGMVMLEISRWGFSLYIRMAPMYETVYGALATVPIFLLWLYLVWSIVLIAALIAAALPDWRAGRLMVAAGEPETRFYNLSACVSVIAVLHRASHSGRPADPKVIRRALAMNASEIDQILQSLRNARFVALTDEGRWVLSRDIRVTTLWDLMEALGYGYKPTLAGIPDPDRARGIADLVERARVEGRRILAAPLVELVEQAGILSGTASPEVSQERPSPDADQKPASPRGS